MAARKVTTYLYRGRQLNIKELVLEAKRINGSRAVSALTIRNRIQKKGMPVEEAVEKPITSLSSRGKMAAAIPDCHPVSRNIR